ncbi:MAG TPA: hypothetical protein VN952_08770 [Chthoniobacterales bacterium]|nr:hypothetical protein [Chthoniobacterales bacterium]
MTTDLQRLAQAKLHKMPTEVRAAYDEANRRLSQTIKNAAEPETVGYTSENAAAVLSAAYAEARQIKIDRGVKVSNKTDPRVTAFDKAVDLVSESLKTARAHKLETLAANKQSEIEKPGAKSLAQLLVEAQE